MGCGPCGSGEDEASRTREDCCEEGGSKEEAVTRTESRTRGESGEGTSGQSCEEGRRRDSVKDSEAGKPPLRSSNWRLWLFAGVFTYDARSGDFQLCYLV